MRHGNSKDFCMSRILNMYFMPRPCKEREGGKNRFSELLGNTPSLSMTFKLLINVVFF